MTKAAHNTSMTHEQWLRKGRDGITPYPAYFYFPRKMCIKHRPRGGAQKPSTGSHFEPTTYKGRLRNRCLLEPIRQDEKKKRTVV